MPVRINYGRPDPAFRHREYIPGHKPRFLVKLQFRTVRQQWLKHCQAFLCIDGVIDLGKNIVTQFVDPFRTAQNLILWNVICVSDASLQADVPHPEYAVAPVLTRSCRWNG